MENKKKRIKFNLFDVIVIAVILLLAAAAYLILNGLPNASENTVTVSYTLELTGLREEMADSVEVGDSFYVTSTGYEIGTVTAVEVVPYTVTATDKEEAVIRNQEVADYVNLQITLEVEVIETDDALTTEDGQVIRTGTSLTASNGTVIGSGFVIWTERGDAE